MTMWVMGLFGEKMTALSSPPTLGLALELLGPVTTTKLPRFSSLLLGLQKHKSSPRTTHNERSNKKLELCGA